MTNSEFTQYYVLIGVLIATIVGWVSYVVGQTYNHYADPSKRLYKFFYVIAGWFFFVLVSALGSIGFLALIRESVFIDSSCMIFFICFVLIHLYGIVSSLLYIESIGFEDDISKVENPFKK